jgi:perosamine synthetase
MIPLSVPSLQGNEWNYVKDCLDTEWVSSAGKYVEKFESDFAAYVGSLHAVACVNGTAALQVALRIAGVQPGDEVIVPTLTFIATINAVSYLGGEPIFMDCDDYYNIDIEKTADFLDRKTEVRNGYTFNKITGKRIAAIVPVHVFGNAVRMQEIVTFCGARGMRVVEDAAESLGTSYTGLGLEGRHTGTIGDIGCFSFNGNKIITTGGGGMIVTDIPEFAEKARYLTTQAKNDEVRYVHDEIGYNFRLTNLQAALGVAQLELLPGFLEIKQHNFATYRDEISKIDGLALGEVPPYGRNNHWMYALQVDHNIYGKNREELMAHLSGHGIQTRPVWHLNHLQAPYRHCHSYRIDKAPRMVEMTLNIPCSANLKESEIDFVVDMLRHG